MELGLNISDVLTIRFYSVTWSLCLAKATLRAEYQGSSSAARVTLEYQHGRPFLPMEVRVWSVNFWRNSSSRPLPASAIQALRISLIETGELGNLIVFRPHLISFSN